jgi:RND family efflux transporter MFP subunit
MTTRTPLLFAIFLTASDLSACDATPTVEAAAPPTEAPEPIEARVRVRVEAARMQPLAELGELTGVVEPFASVVVKAETAARIEARHIERGDQIEAGALLYTLDGSRMRIEYQRAKASIGARQDDKEQAQRELDRAAQLLAREGISAAAHDRTASAAKSAATAEQLAELSARAASRGLRDAKILAPFSGLVAEFHAERGDFVGPGSPVVTLVDLSRVRLRVGLTSGELELAELALASGTSQAGARVPVSFSELGGLTIEAELRSISPLVDPRTGTYAAELWLDNADHRLRQGMLGRVALGRAVDKLDAQLTIPRAAVIRRAGKFAVWVIAAHDEPDRVEARELLLGRAAGERVIVREGLRAGEQVVVEGVFALREGAAVMIESTEE